MRVQKLLDVPYVIVQAGGRGTRLEHFAANKPKCLLSVNGRPMLYALFEHFPDAHFIVVGDYLHDVLDRYLELFPPSVSYNLVRARGTGTVSGIRQALGHIPDASSLLIVWSDLLFDALPDAALPERPLVGLSRSFPCRWSMDEQNHLVEEASNERGVAGLFGFSSKRLLGDLPESGEFVRYLASLELPLEGTFLDDVHELGTLEEVTAYYTKHPVTRFFNEIEVQDRAVVKRARDKAYGHLIDRESDWYEKVSELGFQQVPRLIGRDPFTIERVRGCHPFELPDRYDKEVVLRNIIECLSELHGLDAVPADPRSLHDMYYDKSLSRVEGVIKLVPNGAHDTLRINGLLCRNPFHPRHAEWFRSIVGGLKADTFTLIHGDPTFSNMLVDDRHRPWLIDPRGHFGHTAFHGDPRYDWAKLYYSLVGNYDQFNRKRFGLQVVDSSVDLEIESNGWASLASLLWEHVDVDSSDIELIHALIWISLSGYAKDDVDSVLGSFYNGLFWLEKRGNT